MPHADPIAAKAYKQRYYEEHKAKILLQQKAMTSQHRVLNSRTRRGQALEFATGDCKLPVVV